ncbi:3-ketoacyl-ACP reductase [Clostridium thermosuccinogenes]|jgi:NAD(P)-dependent dehydrogenase (short-subunit alcohol dehydrogenase family)|uniref:3-ketoacyl-ACP reductase n=1 Tax=Clostridium thermosuccinogenes TaxID=84032 RepID=A0A2K2FMS6_9CLOT|nr:3-ketoacyl-ACP reductase [Pseudoclostridium thermosuccinogenes]AUS97745.1 3-ketoacyl-ACP reductase [Pseudoclostridium thermosuccinogenes]PNT93987.1 3-ketoacyl-ACP reductase [Pseudoclostridium thermosuccinogenes]PNT98109.1 3-ketoacyl-ACP reductase [Pseudoclostridium thermosuccinogenes]PNU00080.1 3-ketoacyl-ACP reductase [Pseudoclostridium thermosuccinogenes]
MAKKIAIVTGSRRGIGLGIAKELARNGYTVVISATADEVQASPLMDSLHADGLSTEYIRCDVSNKQDRDNLFSLVMEKYERIDVLVNNAGVAPLKREDILMASEEDFDRSININLKATYFMCQKAANLMIKAMQSGLEDYHPRIINIGSISAYTSSPERSSYCISKAGVSMVTQLFADRLAEYNIPVFEVRPGIILTDMTSVVKGKYEKLIAEGITPIRRFGMPEDVAKCVMAACSGMLDFATGQVINADGGFHIRRL